MSAIHFFYPESRFGGYTDSDGTVALYSRINALLQPSDVVLDFGCGRGMGDEDPVPYRRSLRILQGKASRVIGVDVDTAAQANPHLDEFHLLTGPDIPVEDNSVNMVVCDNVVEHLETPETFFREVARVLRPGGHLCMRTPNLYSYVALASRLVPNKHHAKVLEVAQETRKEEDVFPTHYRCNTVWAIRRQLDEFGFEHAVYGYESEPGYLAFSSIAYAFGVLHQKLMPGWFKPALFCFARLP